MSQAIPQAALDEIRIPAALEQNQIQPKVAKERGLIGETVAWMRNAEGVAQKTLVFVVAFFASVALFLIPVAGWFFLYQGIVEHSRQNQEAESNEEFNTTLVRSQTEQKTAHVQQLSEVFAGMKLPAMDDPVMGQLYRDLDGAFKGVDSPLVNNPQDVLVYAMATGAVDKSQLNMFTGEETIQEKIDAAVNPFAHQANAEGLRAQTAEDALGQVQAQLDDSTSNDMLEEYQQYGQAAIDFHYDQIEGTLRGVEEITAEQQEVTAARIPLEARKAELGGQRAGFILERAGLDEDADGYAAALETIGARIGRRDASLKQNATALEANTARAEELAEELGIRQEADARFDQLHAQFQASHVPEGFVTMDKDTPKVLQRAIDDATRLTGELADAKEAAGTAAQQNAEKLAEATGNVTRLERELAEAKETAGTAAEQNTEKLAEATGNVTRLERELAGAKETAGTAAQQNSAALEDATGKVAGLTQELEEATEALPKEGEIIVTRATHTDALAKVAGLTRELEEARAGGKGGAPEAAQRRIQELERAQEQATRKYDAAQRQLATAQEQVPGDREEVVETAALRQLELNAGLVPELRARLQQATTAQRQGGAAADGITQQQQAILQAFERNEFVKRTDVEQLEERLRAFDGLELDQSNKQLGSAVRDLLKAVQE